MLVTPGAWPSKTTAGIGHGSSNLDQNLDGPPVLHQLPNCLEGIVAEQIEQLSRCFVRGPSQEQDAARGECKRVVAGGGRRGGAARPCARAPLSQPQRPSLRHAGTNVGCEQSVQPPGCTCKGAGHLVVDKHGAEQLILAQPCITTAALLPRLSQSALT